MAPEDLDKLASLIAAGTTQALAASVCGVSTGRVSQLLLPTNSEPEAQALQDAVQAHKAKELAHKRQIDKHIDEAMLALASTLKQLATESTSIGESVRAMALLEELTSKRKAMAAPQHAPSGQHIGLPGGTSLLLGMQLGDLATARINVVLGAQGQIMELGGRSMLPMPAGRVIDLVEAEL